jgi:alkylhydroperoxidase family enzyme
MSERIVPAAAPFAGNIQALLDKVMPPGVAPLVLFTTLARDERLFTKFFSGGLLDKGHLNLRQREIVIDRTTALCGSEYEWGVHVTLFADRVGLTADQLLSIVHGGADDPCWSEDDRLLLRLCDELHRTCTLDDPLWRDLRAVHSEEALLELLMLAGFYRTVSYLTNALQLPLEHFAARFPQPEDTRADDTGSNSLATRGPASCDSDTATTHR